MSRRPANVTQASVARALRAVEQVGYLGVVEIAPDGTIRIVPFAPKEAANTDPPPLDDEPPIEF